MRTPSLMITTRKKESRRSCDLLERDLYARGLPLEALIGRQTWSIRRFCSIAESDRLPIAYVSRRTGERTRSQAVDQAMWDAARVGASSRVLKARLKRVLTEVILYLQETTLLAWLHTHQERFLVIGWRAVGE